MSFPFELVYDHFAQYLVANPLPEDDLHPTLWSITVKDGEITTAAVDEEIGRYFANPLTKALFQTMFDAAVRECADDTCLVLVHESYHRKVDKTPQETAEQLRSRVPRDLSTDPLAQVVVTVALCRPDAYRIGNLPVNEDRSVSYAPLDEVGLSVAGRLVPPSSQTAPSGTPLH